MIGQRDHRGGKWSLLPNVSRAFLIVLASAFAALSATSTYGTIAWDGEANTPFWFNPINWNVDANSNSALPPSNGQLTPVPTDTQIDSGTGPWDLGEGVVYDPANDPGFAAATSLIYPVGFGPQSIQALYVSRATNGANPIPSRVPDNLLTIKGDLTIQASCTIGRSSGIDGQTSNAMLVQKSGLVSVPLSTVDLGGSDTSQAGNANGTWDYRGGSLEIGVGPSGRGGNGVRLSGGSSSLNAVTNRPVGPAGIGKFIEHNTVTPGHVHVISMTLAAFPGVADGVVDLSDPNGVTTGVAIAEFHFENGGTRPIQIDGNLSLNNGADTTGTGLGARSSRLDLRLDSAPAVNGSGVPQDLGLFDVDANSTDVLAGAITGTGSLARTFSSVDGSTNYPQGSTISAIFGKTQYNWTISYTGNITWTNQLNSVVNTIAGIGGVDVVLIGQSTVAIPEPSTLVLVIVGAIGAALASTPVGRRAKASFERHS
jgi:hypothetical protein